MRKIYIHPLFGDINFPSTNIRIHYNKISVKKNNYMKDLINELHKQLKNFLTSIKIIFSNLNAINIQLNLFNDQKQFERYGYLVWNVDSCGGGICIPGMNNKPTNAYVYQTDQGFENLKHELTHAFMNNIFASYYTMYLSWAFVEGLADFFDKGPDNFNKLIQMQGLLVRAC